MEKKIGIIGFGHMGQAMSHALIAQGWHVVASDLGSPKNHPYCCKDKISLLGSNLDVLRGVSVVILAVRPFQMKDTLDEVKDYLIKTGDSHLPLLISIAAGISLKFLMKESGIKKIARVMPNLPAQIGQGMSVWKSVGLMKQEKNLVKKILRSFGKEIEVSDENLINAATAISGSGPGYVFAFLDALQKSAEKLGFSKEQARMLAIQTVLGSTEYAKKSSDEFDLLTSRVATKGGTTSAAFKVLKKIKWQKNLMNAILAAYAKAKELLP